MYVDIVISNVFNLNKKYIFSFFFSSGSRGHHCRMVAGVTTVVGQQGSPLTLGSRDHHCHRVTGVATVARKQSHHALSPGSRGHHYRQVAGVTTVAR